MFKLTTIWYNILFEDINKLQSDIIYIYFYNNYFIYIDVLGSSNWFRKSFIKSDFIPCSCHLLFRSELTCGTKVIWKIPTSFEVISLGHYNITYESCSISTINYCVGYLMGKDEDCAPTFEIIYTSLLYRVRIISIGNLGDRGVLFNILYSLSVYQILILFSRNFW